MTESLSQNPYAAPASNLQEVRHDLTPVPTIEEALSRGYDFQIGAVIEEAWRLVKGSKGIIVLGFIIFYAVMWVLSTIATLLVSLMGVSETDFVTMMVSQTIIGAIATALAYPFLAGVTMVGIRRAAGQPLTANELFSHFSRATALISAALLITLMTYLGFFLLIIPGIYLSVAYMLAIPLIVERGLSPWKAMEVSRKAVTQQWFKIFGLLLLLALIQIVSLIPLGIGLVWSIPLWVISLGILYRTIFGVLPQSN